MDPRVPSGKSIFFSPCIKKIFERGFFLVLAALGFLSRTGLAAGILEPLRPFRTEMPPVIDGVLDDPVWKEAPRESGFKTWDPDYGKDMREGTIVYYAYDRDNLYFAYRCYDREPARIKASITNRDNIINEDWVCLNLDTFNDHQSLYALYVNPLGIQADSRFEGGKEDYTVDIVWYTAGRIDDEGFTVEIRIPFKSIRYDDKDPVEMGVIFERRISRFTEGGTYPPLDPAQGPNFLTQTRPLLFSSIRRNTLVEILPAFTWSGGKSLDQGNLRAEKSQADPSLTGKLGLSSRLILDGTVNPDFSQVEADAGQVDFNLRYGLFYPEKRPFFLEGREKFAFAANQDGDPLGAVVHTRNIVDPLLGFKLNGKLGVNDSIASIYAMDRLADGGPGDFAHFALVRAKHALKKDGYIGGFWTSRFEGPRSNVVAGADGQLRTGPAGMFSFHAFLSGTNAGTGTGAIGGHALGLLYEINKRDWIMRASFQDLDKDFSTETGYLTRGGLSRLKIGVIPVIHPKSRLLLRLEPVFHTILIRDKESGLYETTDAFDLRFILPRNTSLTAGARYATEVYLGRRFHRSAWRIIGTSQFSKNLLFSLTANIGEKIRYVDAPYQGHGKDILATAIYQPSEKFHLEIDLSFSDFTRSNNGVREYDYTILRSMNTYQLNKYLFLRAIVEYNSFWKRMVTDFLASFTYIPGTVIHLGYGAAYEKTAWTDGSYMDSNRFLETRRSFFFKAGYLWRL